MAKSFCDPVCVDKKLLVEIDNRSLKEKCKNTENPFWKSILTARLKYKLIFFDKPLQCYTLWNTYFINNEKLKAWKERMITAKVLYFNDILDESGEVYGYETLRVNTGLKINFVDFLSFKRSIPRDWVKIARDKKGS